MFSFEALKAKHGDALLVHYGPADDPHMLIVDGGPNDVFEDALLPRLEQIAGFKEQRPLTARLAMISHIDDDHITGISDLLRHIRTETDPVVAIEAFWHNSFDDEIGTAELALLADLGRVSASVAASLGVSQPIRMIAAGVESGKRVRGQAKDLGLAVNAGGVLAGFISEGDAANLGHGTKIRVLNPDRGQLLDLQRQWDGVADRLSPLSDAARRLVLARIADDSLANVSSIVVHLRKSGRTMLLTGDARGDHVISGLRAAQLLPGGHAHVDILKLPHHGSDRNVDTNFFRTISADHYVFSGDRDPLFGTNPDKATFQMVTEVRGNDRYSMHFTHSDAVIRSWIREDRELHPRRRYEVVFPAAVDFGIWIDLEASEPLWF